MDTLIGVMSVSGECIGSASGVSSIGGATGAILLGNGLSISGQTLSRIDELPAFPTDTTKEYQLCTKYIDDAWVKYWKIIGSTIKPIVGSAVVGTAIL